MSRTRANGKERRTRRARKNPEPLTAMDALAMLESAVSYCQLAGMSIQAQNSTNANGGNVLRLHIPNAHYVLLDDGTRAAFRLDAMSETVSAAI